MSESADTKTHLGKVKAMAAIMQSFDCMMIPDLRNIARKRPYSSMAASVNGQSVNFVRAIRSLRKLSSGESLY